MPILLLLQTVLATGTAPTPCAPSTVPAERVLAERVLADVARDGRGAWYSATDNVMGGISRGDVALDSSLGCPAMRLRGRVRLENRGGFLLLGLPAGALDTRGYRAVRVVVRGNGERYTLSLRTPDTRTPTQFYDASFVAAPGWATVDLPLAAFRAEDVDAPLDRGRVTQLWSVAKGRAFDADVAVARVTLVR